MKCLHNRGIIHGRLKSRNCVVDGRFVLKVTDYGFNEITNCQNIILEESKPEGTYNTYGKCYENQDIEAPLACFYEFRFSGWLISGSLIQINFGRLQRSCGTLIWRWRGRLQQMYTALLLSCRRWSLAAHPFACWICLLKVRHYHIPLHNVDFHFSMFT